MANQRQSPDSASPEEVADLRERLDEIHRTDLLRWADEAIEAHRNKLELEAMKRTVSWRLTEPLRKVRRRQLEP